ncbi:hypothetical protein AWH48_12195 [Domibacillus aminovorans]|uniref:Uncharacterized protein n=1 Tax=Domibacillus aminovorans TaxID=29332 RepID=A0A177KI85_9BACI|nr:hypothetical protein [Domibacillus aminovorans]OAH53110.1 hypothetical protein AWH48_12195 [Domibacillus aminovorans]
MNENKSLLDQSNFNQQLIIAGMSGLVDDDGFSAREVFQLLEEIKRETYHALLEMQQERKVKQNE